MDNNEYPHQSRLASSEVSPVYAIGGAACFVFCGLVLGIITHYIVAGTPGFWSKAPWFWVLLGVICALVWLIDCMRADQAHTRAIEAERAASISRAIRDSGRAKVIAASNRLAPIQINEAKDQTLLDGQLRTDDIPVPGALNGTSFTLSLARMKKWVENYPAITRAELDAAKVIGGAEDHKRLIIAGEYYGWVKKDRDNGTNGQGVGAKWRITKEQAQYALSGMFADARARARGEDPARARASAVLLAPTAPPEREDG